MFLTYRGSGVEKLDTVKNEIRVHVRYGFVGFDPNVGNDGGEVAFEVSIMCLVVQMHT